MSGIEELRKDVEELRKLFEMAERQKVKDILSVELRKLETEIVHKMENAQESTEPIAKPTAVKAAPSHIPTTELQNYAWDQSDNFMKLYVEVKGVEAVPKENITCEFKDRSLSLLCKGVGSKNYTLQVNSLAEDIVPENSYFKVKTDTVLLMLKKKEVKKKWEYVTSTEKKAKEKRNKKPEFDDTKDPSESLMGLLKQMYDDGDEEMQRSIAKAWYESREKKGEGMI